MDYIENMINERTDHEETQKQLAEKLGWSRPQIARYETRKCVPTIDYLIAFCEHYEVSADFLLNLPAKCKNPRKEK